MQLQLVVPQSRPGPSLEFSNVCCVLSSPAAFDLVCRGMWFFFPTRCPKQASRRNHLNTPPTPFHPSASHPFLHSIHPVHANMLALLAVFSFSEDAPFFTGIFLMDDAAGKTDIDAMVVMDGISDAKVRRGDACCG